MAHENQVLRSIETPDGGRCVDLFRRPDGSHGYQAYRRDAETGTGWFPIGPYDVLTFEPEADALADARERVGWLNDLI